jgi:hypothetical protein
MKCAASSPSRARSSAWKSWKRANGTASISTTSQCGPSKKLSKPPMSRAHGARISNSACLSPCLVEAGDGLLAAIDRANQEYDTGALDIIEPHRRSLQKALARLSTSLKGGADESYLPTPLPAPARRGPAWICAQ